MHGKSVQRSLVGLITVITAVLLSACGQVGGTTAASLLPNLPDYQVSDTQNLQDAIAKVAGGAAVLAGQPEVAGAVVGVNALVTCYQKAGAIQSRSYVKKTDVVKAGVIVIIDRNAVTDPNTFLNCVAPSGPSVRATGIQPCGKTYTLNRDNNQFYIGYAATNPEVCQAFCSALQGCTQ